MLWRRQYSAVGAVKAPAAGSADAAASSDVTTAQEAPPSSASRQKRSYASAVASVVTQSAPAFAHFTASNI